MKRCLYCNKIMPVISFSENAAKDIRGENQYSAKLGTLEVETIRWIAGNYDITKVQMGRMFGVSSVHIGYIVKGTKQKSMPITKTNLSLLSL